MCAIGRRRSSLPWQVFAALVTVTSTTDCTDAYQVLTAQMDDMQAGSTKVAFQLASPENRISTAAPGGYNMARFDHMVRSSLYSPLLSGHGYEVIWHGKQGPSQYVAKVRVFHYASKQRFTVFRFEMSMQSPSVIDEDVRLGAFNLTEGHPPQWRTDSVLLVESGRKKTSSSKKTPAKKKRSSSKKTRRTKKRRENKKAPARKSSKRTPARKKSGSARKKRNAK